MNVLDRLKFYFTRLLALLSGTQHGEISKTILCVTAALYLACQIFVVLNRDHCSAKVLTQLSQANYRLRQVEFSLENLEKTVVGLMKDKDRAERVVRSTHDKARRQATRARRHEIRYLKRKLKALEKRLLVSLNHTDDNGRYPCIHFHIDEEDLRNKHKIKKPKQEASGRDKQKDTSKRNSNQAAQRKKKGTNKRKMSRRITVYTRWGTTQCRTSNKSQTSLVYTGRVAAPRYTDKGGGSNYLCLPDRPLYSNQGNVTENHTAHLYPVKFGNLMKIFNKFGPLVLKGLSPELQKKFITNLDFKDVPCAVCEVEGATSVLMMPAYNYCPGRWNRQYHGYLMSQKHDYGKTEFICVDVEARGIPNTQNSNGNAFLHLTEFKCSGPSCIGYYPNKALACAVCTK